MWGVVPPVLKVCGWMTAPYAVHDQPRQGKLSQALPPPQLHSLSWKEGPHTHCLPKLRPDPNLACQQQWGRVEAQ